MKQKERTLCVPERTVMNKKILITRFVAFGVRLDTDGESLL
jgi:hypothetical protein